MYFQTISLEIETPSIFGKKYPISSPHFSSYKHYVLSPKKKTIIGFWLVQIDLTDSEQLSDFFINFSIFSPQFCILVHAEWTIVYEIK